MRILAGQIHGILLAAGFSTRFGSNKLLHLLPDGTPIALAAARNMLAALPRTVAVVHSGRSALARLLIDAGCTLVVARNAREGMGTSLAAGVRATRDAAGWVVGLADMPFVRPATIGAVAKRLARGAALAAPSLDGARGHPVGIAGSFRDELLGLKGDQGARAILERNAGAIELIPTEDRGVLRDVDTPADLAPLLSTAGGRGRVARPKR